MQKAILIDKINLCENWLEAAAKSIRKCLDNHKENDNISSWIRHLFVANEEEILSYFHLQNSSETNQAVSILLNRDTVYKQAMYQMITQRIMSYVSSAIDLKYHRKNQKLAKIEENFRPLIQLINVYRSNNIKPATIRNVVEFLSSEDKSQFKKNPYGTDIRLVLKTILWDENKKVESPTFIKLLDFLHAKLIKNKTIHGTIIESRHAWWAFKDLLTYRDDAWISDNKASLGEILEDLMKYDVWVSNHNTSYGDILEASTEYYEKMWVIENAISIFKILTKDYPTIIGGTTIDLLKDYIEKNIDEQFRMNDRPDTLRNYQCDLILLYEIIDNYEILFEVDPIIITSLEENNRITPGGANSIILNEQI